MGHLKQPFQLGHLTLSSNIFCAPLAGCSDLPFRRMTSSFQPGLVYCEMVKMDALIRHDPSSFRLLDYEAGMHPIGGQLCGSKPKIAGKCAKIIEDLGFDVVDLNCGCPVDKVTKDGSGSGMLKNPDLIGEVISEMVAAVKIPVTVKVRAGWDTDQINCVEVTQIAEKAGAKAICIHGRTRQQGYKGPSNWDHISACKRAAKEIKVIGNGDLFDAQAVKKMFEATSCDAVLIARGTMGQPWIIEDVMRLFGDEEPIKRSSFDYRDTLLLHLQHVLSYQNDRKAVQDLRRISCWYLKKGIGTRPLKESLNRSKDILEMKRLIIDFPWHETEFVTTLPETETCEAEC